MAETVTEVRTELDILESAHTWLTWIHVLNNYNTVKLDAVRLADLRRDIKHMDTLISQKKAAERANV